MRAGFYSTPLSRQPIRQAAASIKAAGYDAIELNGDGLNGASQPHLTPLFSFDECRRIAGDIRETGLGISAMSANVHLIKEDGEATARAMSYVERMIDRAAVMQVPFVHVFTGLAPKTMPAGEARGQRLIECFGALTEYAAQRELAFGIEGCAPHLFPRTADYQSFIEALGNIPLKVCFDPSHFAAHGENPAAAVRALGGRIAHVHIKDERGIYPNFSFPPLGQGTIDFAE